VGVHVLFPVGWTVFRQARERVRKCVINLLWKIEGWYKRSFLVWVSNEANTVDGGTVHIVFKFCPEACCITWRGSAYYRLSPHRTPPYFPADP
jgi:hypothetical protein